MRFRLGLAAGFAVGYVLGARAGRERFEQMREVGTRLLETSAGERIRRPFMQVTSRIPSLESDAGAALETMPGSGASW